MKRRWLLLLSFGGTSPSPFFLSFSIGVRETFFPLPFSDPGWTPPPPLSLWAGNSRNFSLPSADQLRSIQDISILFFFLFPFSLFLSLFCFPAIPDGEKIVFHPFPFSSDDKTSSLFSSCLLETFTDGRLDSSFPPLAVFGRIGTSFPPPPHIFNATWTEEDKITALTASPFPLSWIASQRSPPPFLSSLSIPKPAENDMRLGRLFSLHSFLVRWHEQSLFSPHLFAFFHPSRRCQDNNSKMPGPFSLLFLFLSNRSWMALPLFYLFLGGFPSCFFQLWMRW